MRFFLFIVFVIFFHALVLVYGEGLGIRLGVRRDFFVSWYFELGAEV